MTVSSNKNRQYGRFIPREEVGEVTHWQFGAVGGAEAVLPLSRLGLNPAAHAQAVAQAEAEAACAAAQAAEREQEHDLLLQQSCEAAHAQGLAQGHAQATAEWQQRLDDHVSGAGREAAERLQAVAQALDASLEAMQKHMAQDVLQLACALARQVVRQELRTQPAALQPVVAEALDMLVADGRPATVRLHPDDDAQVGAALREAFAGRPLQWLADAEVAPGGCVVEAAGAVVDGSLEQRWQRALAALGMDSFGPAWGDGDGI